MHFDTLQQGVVCPREHSFPLSQGINLAGACRLACLEIVQQPITITMSCSEELMSGHGLLHGGRLGLLILDQSCLSVCLEALLVGDRLGIACALVRTVFPC